MTRQRLLLVGWALGIGGLAIALASFAVPSEDRARGLLLVVGSCIELVGIIMISMARRKPEGR